MTPEFHIVSEHTAEVQLPDGCPTCGGPVDLRVSGSSSARAVCTVCHVISAVRVRAQGSGLMIDFRPRAQA